MNALPLEKRDNPTEWVQLFRRALPALDHVFGEPKAASPAWTLGGGTAIALRIAHRLSDDVDIFVPGTALKQFAPANNPASRLISEQFQWPGHYLKFELPEGEIDFLSPPLQTEPGYTFEPFEDRAIALETLEEVIIKKIRFRAARFTARDVFDLAAVGRHEPRLAAFMAKEAGDALPRLRTALQASASSLVAQLAALRARPAFADLKKSALLEATGLVESASSMSTGG